MSWLCQRFHFFSHIFGVYLYLSVRDFIFSLIFLAFIFIYLSEISFFLSYFWRLSLFICRRLQYFSLIFGVYLYLSVGDCSIFFLFLAFFLIYLLCFFDVLRFYATFILRAMSESRTVYRLWYMWDGNTGKLLNRGCRRKENVRRILPRTMCL